MTIKRDTFKAVPMAKHAIFPYVRVESCFASLFQGREREKSAQL